MSFEVNYNKEKILGKGSFGTVIYEGRYGEKSVAVKSFPSISFCEENFLKLLENANKNDHKNVMHFHNVKVTDEMKIVAAMDIYSTNLEQYFSTEQKVEPNAEKSIAEQIVNGMHYLHNSSIVHGNLCPPNVLLRNTQEGILVVISDFRMYDVVPIRWKEIARSSNVSFRTGWMASEILQKLQSFDSTWTKQNDKITVVTTFSSDIFAVGCLLYYVVTRGDHPFGRIFVRENNILTSKPAYAFSSIYLPLVHLVHHMIAEDPSTRPSITTVQSFPWFWSISKEKKFLDDLNGFIGAYENKTKSALNCLRSSLIEFMQAFSDDEDKSAVEVTMEEIDVLLKAATNESIRQQLEIKNSVLATFWLTDYQSTFIFLVWESFSSIKVEEQLNCYYSESTQILTSSLSSVIKLTNFITNQSRPVMFQKTATLRNSTEDSKATQTQKADKLYEILPSRKGAYDILLNASRETSQSGVVEILEEVKLDHNLSVALEECLNDEFCYRNTNPVFLTADLKFETLRRAVASYVDLEIFRMILDVKKSMEPWLLRGPINETLLHVSVAYGYIKMIEYLISLGVDVNSVDGFGRTALHYMGKFSTNMIATTNVFISKGYNLRQVDKDDMTIVTTVASYGTINQFHYHHWAEYMIKNKYRDLFAQKLKEGCTPLHHLMKTLDLEKNTLEMILRSTKMSVNQPDDRGKTILHWALKFGRRVDTIKNLLELKADYKMKCNMKKSALHFAVLGGNKEVITFLILLKLNINEVDEFGQTPLHEVRFTMSRDYLGVTKFLLDKGAHLGAKDKNGNNVAHLFAGTGNISSEDFHIWVKGMIDDGHGSIFAIRGQGGRTPIQAAMQRLDLDLTTLKLMLESSKLDIDHHDEGGNTELHLALGFGRSMETIKILISLGAEIKMKNKEGNGVLHLAVIGGNKEIIQYLLSNGLDVNEKNNEGSPPLHFVSWTKPKKHVELTMLLLHSGADLYYKDNGGKTLAHLMAIVKNVSCDDFKFWVTAMIENGHVHLFTIRGQLGKTPLHCAMQRHDLDLETIKLIVESAKLDTNQTDDNGNAILHSALSFGRSFNTIENLVALGVDWKKKGRQGGSVLHFAVRGSNKEAFLYFKSLGADVNAKDEDGETPLHDVRWTRSKDYLGMTTFLLENGADLNAKDTNGKTVDQLMSSCDEVSAEEYNEWNEGMIKLGHASLFH